MFISVGWTADHEPLIGASFVTSNTSAFPTYGVLFFLLVFASTARGQTPTTQGFNLGAHLSGASLEPEGGDRSNAGGGGIIVGYGFNSTFELFLQIDGAEFDVQDTDVDGTWTMGHVDLGGRFHFSNPTRSWVPYLQAALTGRGVSIDNAVVLGQAETDVGFFGGGLTLGGGIMFYFNESLAADLQLAWTGGRFTEIKINNVTISGLELDARSARFSVGVSWWP